MVTILPKDENSWSDIGERFAGGLTSGYMNRSDEMALQKAVQDLGPNASARDILNAVTGAKTYGNESKQQFIKNLVGAQELDESIRHAKVIEEETKKRNQLAEDANRLKGELKALEDQKKVQKDMNDALTLIDSSNLEHDEKDTLREKAKNGEVSFEAIKSVLKEKKGQEKGGLEKKAHETTQRAFNSLASLIPKVGRSRILESTFGGETAGSFAEFTSLTGALEALLVEQVNRGALSNTRFNYIKNDLLPKPGDSQAEIRGKLKGLATDLNLDPAELGVEGEKATNKVPEGKIRVKNKKTGKTGTVTPFEGMDEKYERI